MAGNFASDVTQDDSWSDHGFDRQEHCGCDCRQRGSPACLCADNTKYICVHAEESGGTIGGQTDSHQSAPPDPETSRKRHHEKQFREAVI